MYRYKIIAIFILMVLMACEEQPIPIPDPPAPGGRVVLIEELTGVDCVPCFAAAALVEEIVKGANGSVIVYGIHGLLQAGPITGSKFNFTNDDNIELENSFDFFGKPAAAFNRIPLANGNSADSGTNDWQSFVDQELAKPQVAEIFISASFDEATRVATINVGVVPLEDISGEVNLHMVIAESNLIDAQNTPNGILTDFEHDHVMRASLTGLTGDFLGENLIADDLYSKPYTYTVPVGDGEWVPENIEIIGFITAKDRNGEVQHASQIQLTN